MKTGKYVYSNRVEERKNGFGIPQILSTAIILICLITLFLPWLYIGIKTDSGRKLDLTDLYDIADLGYDVKRFDVDDLPDAAARKELRATRKAVSQIISILRDSKLSPTETATGCINIARVYNFLNKYAYEDMPSEALWIFLIGTVFGLLIFIFAALGVCCILAELRGKQSPLKGALCIYLLLLLLNVIPTVYVNLSLKDGMNDGLGSMIGLFGIGDTSLLHIQFAPILGSVLLAGSLVIKKKGLPQQGLDPAAISAISKKVIWKCECGCVNPTGSKFCPQCGKARPEDVAALDLKKDVLGRVFWTCSCGSRNPNTNAFCAKCGAKHPSSQE